MYWAVLTVVSGSIPSWNEYLTNHYFNRLNRWIKCLYVSLLFLSFNVRLWPYLFYIFLTISLSNPLCSHLSLSFCMSTSLFSRSVYLSPSLFLCTFILYLPSLSLSFAPVTNWLKFDIGSGPYEIAISFKFLFDRCQNSFVHVDECVLDFKNGDDK